MRKGIYTFALSFSLLSCKEMLKENNLFSNSSVEVVDEQVLVGGEKDESGCATDAGYTWSYLLQDCIRSYEKGYRLNSVDTTTSKRAFLLFNKDSTKVEVFANEFKKSILLNKKGKKYQADRIVFDKEEFSIYLDDKKIYQAAQPIVKNIDTSIEMESQ